RRAVALSCNMARCHNAREELIHLSAVDFLTGEVLVNKIVKTRNKPRNWRASVTGMTAALMAEAAAAGQALPGWPVAREALFQYIDSETVLVGHMLQYDLNLLGILASRVVDSDILSGEALFGDSPLIRPFRQVWRSPGRLSSQLLRGSDQPYEDPISSCLERAMETREVVLQYLQTPKVFEQW
ncbi:hypothetical protein ASPZODRAFT_31187, partial [Penicilliopsis zonata CBS 506.65]